MEIGDNFWQSYCIEDNSIGLYDSKSVPRPDSPLSMLVFNIADCFDLQRHLTENGIESTEVRPAGVGDFNLFFATGPDGEKLAFFDR